MGNQVKTIFLLGILTAILVVIGSLFGKAGTLFAFCVALLLNLGAYWFSDRIVLTMYRAREVSESQAPDLYRMVRELSAAVNLPLPKVYVYPSANPNAFATGRNPSVSAVAVSTGLLELLNTQELKGVLAHEISHIKDRDVLVATVAATLAAAITFLARMLQWTAIFGGSRRDERGGNILSLVGMVLMAILAPIAAMLIQMAVSRNREYLADAEGAKISGNPLFLANALRKLQRVGREFPLSNPNPATSHLFIVRPFMLRGLMVLFSTHPPIEERIARLENMAR